MTKVAFLCCLLLSVLISNKGFIDGFSSSSNCHVRFHHGITSSQKDNFGATKTIRTDLMLSSTSSVSSAAEWHRNRRKQMLDKYGDKIGPMERTSSSQPLAGPLLILTNASLLILSIMCGRYWNLPTTIALALFPGSILSLWQLQILHDCLHGSLFSKKTVQNMKLLGISSKKQLQDLVLFWGSMPSIFGYYLYLKFGHLSHHSNVGDPTKASLAKLFNSHQADFEDGDVLFVAHRMKLLGDIGPTFHNLPFRKNKPFTMSISNSAFQTWKDGSFILNTIIFASSFLFERFMLVINDAVVALTRHNAFFPNKPKSFHTDCAKYAQCATLLRILLLYIGGWKSLLFLYLVETLWSIPPHPASAMFVTNHPSHMNDSNNNDSECTPSMSTYAGKWYSLLTLGTNYHCEHHDFPTIPLHKLGQLRKIAPEFYRTGSKDNIFHIMKQTFAKPDFYACMNVNNIE